jgi:transposase InsO family protein
VVLVVVVPTFPPDFVLRWINNGVPQCAVNMAITKHNICFVVMAIGRKLGIETIYREPRTSLAAPGHQIYPYLLGDLEINGPDQAWCADITYVPMAQGFLYLVAVMEWWSRYVLAWRLSNTLESAVCVEAWEAALQSGRQAPLISNTDQGRSSPRRCLSTRWNRRA